MRRAVFFEGLCAYLVLEVVLRKNKQANFRERTWHRERGRLLHCVHSPVKINNSGVYLRFFLMPQSPHQSLANGGCAIQAAASPMKAADPSVPG